MDDQLQLLDRQLKQAVKRTEAETQNLREQCSRMMRSSAAFSAESRRKAELAWENAVYFVDEAVKSEASHAQVEKIWRSVQEPGRRGRSRSPARQLLPTTKEPPPATP